MRPWFRPPALPAGFDLELGQGLHAHVRPIGPQDAPRFERGYAQLSETSRRQRFFGQASALSKTQIRFLTDIDHVNHSAWAALDRAQPDAPGIGVGRYIRLEGGSDEAEVALTVLDAHQHRGAGSALHACLHLTAAHHGLRGFLYDVSQDNERFLHHLKALGAEQVNVAEHIVRLRMPVYPRPGAVPRTQAAGAAFSDWLARLKKAAPAAS